VITDRFDSKTMLIMEMALEQACRLLPTGEAHSARRYVASRILECVENGDETLDGLTEAASAAARDLSTAHDASRSDFTFRS
jgi:hypothetical protein